MSCLSSSERSEESSNQHFSSSGVISSPERENTYQRNQIADHNVRKNCRAASNSSCSSKQIEIQRILKRDLDPYWTPLSDTRYNNKSGKDSKVNTSMVLQSELDTDDLINSCEKVHLSLEQKVMPSNHNCLITKEAVYPKQSSSRNEREDLLHKSVTVGQFISPRSNYDFTSPYFDSSDKCMRVAYNQYTNSPNVNVYPPIWTMRGNASPGIPARTSITQFLTSDTPKTPSLAGYFSSRHNVSTNAEESHRILPPHYVQAQLPFLMSQELPRPVPRYTITSPLTSSNLVLTQPSTFDQSQQKDQQWIKNLSSECMKSQNRIGRHIASHYSNNDYDPIDDFTTKYLPKLQKQVIHIPIFRMKKRILMKRQRQGCCGYLNLYNCCDSSNGSCSGLNILGCLDREITTKFYDNGHIRSKLHQINLPCC